jgi:hypothetical protein
MSLPILFEAVPPHAELPDQRGLDLLLGDEPAARGFAWEAGDLAHAGGPDAELQIARRWFANRLRDQYARSLGVGRGGQVHHAIELQVLRRYPGAYAPAELNALSNMRGVPGELDPAVFARRQAALRAALARRRVQPGSPGWATAVSAWSDDLRRGDLRRRQLHNSHIRAWWDRQYAGLDAALAARGLRPSSPGYRPFVRSHLDAGRDGLDQVLSGLFAEQRRAYDWAATGQGTKDNATIGQIDPATGRVRRP